MPRWYPPSDFREGIAVAWKTAALRREGRVTRKPPASAWVAMTLTVVPLLATAAFAIGAVVLLIHPPAPREDLPTDAGVAFLLYTAITGAVAVLGVLLSIGLTKGWGWSRPVGTVVFLVAGGLVITAIATGANDASQFDLAIGGVALVACLTAAALTASGR